MKSKININIKEFDDGIRRMVNETFSDYMIEVRIKDLNGNIQKLEINRYDIAQLISIFLQNKYNLTHEN